MLTTEQILLLENLTYLPKENGINPIRPDQSLAEWLNTCDLDAINVGEDLSLFTSGQEWKDILQAVKSDPQLCQVRLVNEHYMPDYSGGGYSMVFKDPSTGEGIIAFRGTATQEWKDNFVGGAKTDTPDGVSTKNQMDALQWYQNEIDKSEFSSITVTGHSKGGNKAKYITIMDDSVDRCVSFDGQGFSDNFMYANQSQIQKNQGKISNHNVEGDYVNLLLNDIGDTTYYKAQNVQSGFAENHCPNTLFKVNSDNSVAMIQGSQDPAMRDLDSFLNGYLRSLSEDERKNTLVLIGSMMQDAQSGEGIDTIIHELFKNDNAALSANLLAYLLKYKEENPDFLNSIYHVLDECNLNNISEMIADFEDLTEQKWFMELVKFLSDTAINLDDLYYWKLDEWLSDKGIHLTKEELEALIRVLYQVADTKDKMRINYNGDDISFPSSGICNNHFFVLNNVIHSVGDNFEAIAYEIDRCKEELGSLHKKLRFVLSLFVKGFDESYIELEKNSRSCKQVSQALMDIENQYTSSEGKIVSF